MHRHIIKIKHLAPAKSIVKPSDQAQLLKVKLEQATENSNYNKGKREKVSLKSRTLRLFQWIRKASPAANMDSDDEIGIDSGNVSSDEDYDFMQVDEIQRQSGTAQEPVDYPYEVLTTEEIVQHMLDCIAEVNNVVEVSRQMRPKSNGKKKFHHNWINEMKKVSFCCCYVNNIRVSIQ